MVAEIKLEMEKKSKSHEQHCLMLEMKARETQAELEGRIKEIELLLQQSRQTAEELKEVAESNTKSWNLKEQTFKKFMSSQLQSLQVFIQFLYAISLELRSEWKRHKQGLRVSSNSMRDDIRMVQKTCMDDFTNMGEIPLTGLLIFPL